MYQSELCDADKRGRLVSSEPLFVGVGIVIAYFFETELIVNTRFGSSALAAIPFEDP